jgi:hypothetical protein
LSNTQKGGQTTTVELLGGTYYLPPPSGTSTGGTLQFAASDSGTAVSGAGSVTWTNAPGQTAIISGGLPATAIPGFGGWICNNGVCSASLPSTVPEFENLFYFNGDTTSTSDGRRLRSRAYSSNGAPGTSAAVGYYWKSGACYSTYTNQQVGDNTLCNFGTYLRVKNTIAPSDSFGTGCVASADSNTPPNYKCLDRFYYDPNDGGAIFAWSNLHATSTCPTQSSTGVNYPAGDVTITLFDAWAVERMRVSCVDTTDHIVYFSGATGSGGGGTNYNFFGPAVGHRFIVENTLDAFSDDKNNALSGRTGVWFRDRYANTLSYIPNSLECPVVGFNGCTQADQPGVVIPLTAPNMSSTFPRGSLLYASGLTNAAFQRSVDSKGNGDFIFEADNFVIPSTGLNYDENEEAKLPQAIDCESCVNVTFNGITVRHTSASGILFASSSQTSGTPGHNDTLENSAFYDIGDSGIRVGHENQSSDTTGAAVNNITVTNNIVQGFSRVYADGEGIGQGNGNTIAYLNNDIRDGYHAAISVCNAGCSSGAHVADGSHTLSQYNHISNIMQGVTSDGGTLYYGTGFTDGYGAGNQIFNNLVHDTTDSSIIDSTACPGQSHCSGTGYGGQGIYLDNATGGVDVEANVVFRISQNALWMSKGPALGTPGNTFHNNIAAFAIESLFQESSPWPSQNSNFGYPNGCYPRSADGPMASLTNNIFYFDRNLTYQPASAPQGFSVVQGCPYTCSDQGSGLTSYNQFHNFQGDLYWRTDGTLATDAKSVFHVQTRAPSAATGCYGSTNPANNWTFFPFSAASGNNWQTSSAVTGLISWSLTGGMNEDLSGTASIDPGLNNGFGTNQGQRNYWTGDKTDFLLSGVPSGWQSAFNWGGSGTGNCAFTPGTPDGTNCTILYAGRNGTTPNTPSVVPATYPTYSYTYIQTHPMGIQVTDNSASLGVSPVSVYLEKSTPHTLAVPATTILNGITYYFSKWEDGSQNTSHATFTVNTVDTAPKPYFATYVGATTTTAGGATATYGDASVNLTAGVKVGGSPVTEGTVTFLVYHGTSTSGSPTPGSVNSSGIASATYVLSGSGVTTAGSWTILATFNGTGNYRTSLASATLTVTKAGLTVAANSASKSYGSPNPAFTATITGFVSGDGPGVVGGSPYFSTTATTGSPVGTYPITVTQGTLSAVNYTFTNFVPGTLTVNPAAPAFAKIGTYNAGQWYLDVNGNGSWDGDPPDVAGTFGIGLPGAVYVTGDWNGDGHTKMGVYYQGFWYLDFKGDGAWDGGVVDKQYNFGWPDPNVIPVVGDWNGDGRTKIGIYYQGFWYLDYDGNGVWDGGINDKAYNIGWPAPGVTPIVGDWSGSGTTKIGIYYNGFWYLDYDGNGVFNPVSDKAYNFGWQGAGVTPIVGDWSGSGTTKIGIYYTGFWYLDYDGNGVWDGGVADKQYNLGWPDPAVKPLMGDWTGTGTAKIGIFYDGYWYLDFIGNGIWDGGIVDKVYVLGQPGDTPVVGAW